MHEGKCHYPQCFLKYYNDQSYLTTELLSCIWTWIAISSNRFILSDYKLEVFLLQASRFSPLSLSSPTQYLCFCSLPQRRLLQGGRRQLQMCVSLQIHWQTLWSGWVPPSSNNNTFGSQYKQKSLAKLCQSFLGWNARHAVEPPGSSRRSYKRGRHKLHIWEERDFMNHPIWRSPW